MVAILSKVLSLDLEMNYTGKIIQLGYVIADVRSNNILIDRCIYVNPYEKLGVLNNGIHITDYTGITQEDVDCAPFLDHAYLLMCEDIKALNVSKTCIQWGDGFQDNKGDHDAIRQQLGLSWDEFVFRPRAWDVKSQYQIYQAFRNNRVVGGVAAALRTLGLEFIGREHNALDDALNTYRIFYELGIKMKKYDDIMRLVK